jgi:hypothetical protein
MRRGACSAPTAKSAANFDVEEDPHAHGCGQVVVKTGCGVGLMCGAFFSSNTRLASKRYTSNTHSALGQVLLL